MLRPSFLSVLLPLSLAAVLGGCSGADERSAPPAATPPGADAGAPAPGDAGPDQPPSAPELPDTPAGQALRWVLGLLNGEVERTPEDALAARFSPSFLAQASPSEIREAILAESRKSAPFTLVGIAPEPRGPTRIAGIVRTKQGRIERLDVVTTAHPEGKIEGLLLTIAPELDPKLDSWPEVLAELGAIAPKASVLAAELRQGACVARHALTPDQPLAIGSAFKLYVLGALARRVQRGAASWDTPLAVNDAWKSLPSGEMQNAPSGATFPLRHYAAEMIRISDNTATDHLMGHLGRAAVEEALSAFGHAAPERTLPFLTTREAFVLKLLLSPEEQSAYARASIPERRALLEGYASRDPRGADARGWTTPRLIEDIEWFASANDLCRALGALRDLAETPEAAPVGEILAKNPGLPFDPKRWRYAGFKGGSEPGVLNMSWLLRRSDDTWFVLTTGFNDPARPLDGERATYAAAAAAALLGRDP